VDLQKVQTKQRVLITWTPHCSTMTTKHTQIYCHRSTYWSLQAGQFSLFPWLGGGKGTSKQLNNLIKLTVNEFRDLLADRDSPKSPRLLKKSGEYRMLMRLIQRKVKNTLSLKNNITLQILGFWHNVGRCCLQHILTLKMGAAYSCETSLSE
jgi:hypothetical protein